METIVFYRKSEQYIFIAGYNRMHIVSKRITESKPLGIEFSNSMPEGEILNSATSTVTAEDSSGTDRSSILIGSVEVINETLLQCKVLADGVLNTEYIITFKGVTLPSAYVIEEQILLQIRENSLV